MYCRYCGKQIEDDSLFCRYCGKKLFDIDEGKSYFSGFKNCKQEGFKSLPIVIQCFIVVYVLYLLIWLCCLISNDFRESIVIDFIVFAIIIPFVLVCFYYFWGVYKRDKQTALQKSHQVSKEEKNSVEEVEVSESFGKGPKEILESKRFVSKIPLMEFAGTHGKMRLIERTNNKGEVVRYCIFEKSDADGTIVLFPEDKEALSAEEISKDKYILWIKECSNGTFYLDYY